MIPLLVLTGPTASGKSGLALALALRLNGEIVSCDSMQVYRECDVVTAKPTLSERALVPHHLLDICEPCERFSAAQWAQRATDCVSDVLARGKTPVICGGTGFYLRAWLEPDSVAVPAPDEGLRAALELALEREGAQVLRDRLRALEPAIEASLVRGDNYRLVRALQIATQRARGDAVPSVSRLLYAPQIFCLDWPRAELYQRIEARVDAMCAAGALDELRALTNKWGTDAPALGGVGYKQLQVALAAPDALPSAMEAWKRDTRRYAKRQITWFRHQTQAVWLDAHLPTQTLLEQIVASLDGAVTAKVSAD